jgi:glutamine synthetase
MIRIPAPGRIENRAVDGAANPYLASAAMLAAGFDGIEKKIDPGVANTENLYELAEKELERRNIAFLPTTLREALDCFERDEVLQQALGLDCAAYYASVKRQEWREYHQSISEWERDHYLHTF